MAIVTESLESGRKSHMHATVTAPPHWTVRETAAGREIRCARRAGEGRLAAWLFIGALVAICGYGTAVFVLGWLAGEEILVGGVVVFALLLGGLFAGLYLISAMFRTTTYRLGGESLSITAAQPVIGESTDEIARSNIREVIRVCRSPRQGSRRDAWRTLLVVRNAPRAAGDSGDAESGAIALEGDTPDESAWLAALIAEWANVRVRVEQNPAD